MNSEYYCNYCDVMCGKKSDLLRHEKTKKHFDKMNNSKNDKPKFECIGCDYRCSKLSIFNKHLSTNKHQMLERNKSHDIASAVATERNCPSQNGTFSKCSEIPLTDYMTIIRQLLGQNSELLNQNNELKNFIIEQAGEHKNFVIEQANEHKKETLEIVNRVIENVKPVTNNNNTINGNVNNNQKFNINLYLNEHCKDAINFSDFVKNIEVSREDLENNAQLGFVGGFSKILIEHLKQLDKSERPIHCTDVKRETMYIKDDDKWNKEENPTKLNQAIQEVTRKSMRTLLDWKAENPDYKDNDSEFSNRCIVIQQQSMAAHNRDTYYPKIIHAIAKETMVDK